MDQLMSLTPMLKTLDVRRTMEFYKQILGFELGSIWPENEPCWCSLHHGVLKLMFSTQAHASPTPLMTGTLYITVNDVLGLHRQIKDKVEVLWGPEIYHYGMHEFAIKDCNGYTLSFGQPTDEPPTCKGGTP